MSDDPWIHAEADLSKHLGLQRADVRTVRSEALEQGKDWKHVRGAVRYTAAGWNKLCALLKISPAKLPVPSSPTAAGQDSAPNADRVASISESEYIAILEPDYVGPSLLRKNVGEHLPALPRLVATTRLTAGARHELVVAKIYLNNPRIVQARFGRVLVRVRVKDSENLTPGLAMQCTWIEADLWQLATRLPRWKGKW